MVQVDIPAAFTIGQILALSSSKYLAKTEEITTNRLIGPLNFYLSIGFIPIGMFLMVAWPSWEVMYVSPWVEKTFDSPLVGGFYIGFLMIMLLLGNAGFMLAHYCYQKGKGKVVPYTAILGAVLTVLPFILRWGVWMQIGTYDQIQSHTGYSFWNPPFFYGWLCILSYGGICLLTAILWFRKKGNNL